MKKIIQLSLLIVLIFISGIFYINYFEIEKKNISNIDKKGDDLISENQNNRIKNLKYQVKFDNNSEYNITAEYSELMYIDEIEMVKMNNVSAKFIDQRNTELIIISDNAVYNNSNYNTNFTDSVQIKYMDNVIKSENLNLNFVENIVLISDNVVYEGLQGLMKADNIKINLITKNVEISMYNKKNKVEVQTK